MRMSRVYPRFLIVTFELYLYILTTDLLNANVARQLQSPVTVSSRDLNEDQTNS